MSFICLFELSNRIFVRHILFIYSFVIISMTNGMQKSTDSFQMLNVRLCIQSKSDSNKMYDGHSHYNVYGLQTTDLN